MSRTDAIISGPRGELRVGPGYRVRKNGNVKTGWVVYSEDSERPTDPVFAWGCIAIEYALGLVA
jgi:hypothetical protein